MSFQPKSKIPTHMVVMVCEVKECGNMYPLMKIESRADQHVTFASGGQNAPLGLRVLQQAVELCLKKTTQLAAERIAQNLAEGKEGGQ